MNINQLIPKPYQVEDFLKRYAASIISFILVVFTPYSVIAKWLYAILIHIALMAAWGNAMEYEDAFYEGTKESTGMALITLCICSSILLFFSHYYLMVVTILSFVGLSIVYYNNHFRKENGNETA